MTEMLERDRRAAIKEARWLFEFNRNTTEPHKEPVS